ncbi:MAG: hypothetical protein WD512_14205 [Candidatus Paceibacterota bacterium]
MSNFVKEFLALVKGDTEERDALKVKRQAISALKARIHVMDGETMDLEQNIDDANSELEKATLNNGDALSGDNQRDRYVSGLIYAKNRVTDAEEALEENKLTLNFLKEKLSEIEGK